MPAELGADATRYPALIEEMLRLEAPIQFSPRRVAEDVEKRGRVLRKGDVDRCSTWRAANRDPERFAEPDRSTSSDRTTGTCSFAWGPHFCLGAPLARTEAAVSLTRALRTLPDVRLTRHRPHLAREHDHARTPAAAGRARPILQARAVKSWRAFEQPPGDRDVAESQHL